MITITKNEDIGKILKQRRKQTSLTLKEISESTGVSSSHLSRIEKGDRFPSASVLRRIAGPLGFQETELMMLVGYLSPTSIESQNTVKIDPHVARILSEEPVEIQRVLVDILNIIKRIDHVHDTHVT